MISFSEIIVPAGLLAALHPCGDTIIQGRRIENTPADFVSSCLASMKTKRNVRSQKIAWFHIRRRINNRSVKRALSTPNPMRSKVPLVTQEVLFRLSKLPVDPLPKFKRTRQISARQQSRSMSYKRECTLIGRSIMENEAPILKLCMRRGKSLIPPRRLVAPYLLWVDTGKLNATCNYYGCGTRYHKSPVLVNSHYAESYKCKRDFANARDRCAICINLSRCPNCTTECDSRPVVQVVGEFCLHCNDGINLDLYNQHIELFRKCRKEPCSTCEALRLCDSCQIEVLSSHSFLDECEDLQSVADHQTSQIITKSSDSRSRITAKRTRYRHNHNA